MNLLLIGGEPDINAVVILKWTLLSAGVCGVVQLWRRERGQPIPIMVQEEPVFPALSCMGMSTSHCGTDRSIVSQFLDSGFEAAVEVIDISYASVEGAAIADFLKNTPRLRILTYLHKTEGSVGFQDWDLCRFITAIENEAGSHLEELSIRIGELHGSIIPRKVSMRGFQNLQRLEIPLETAMCNLTSAASSSSASHGHELLLRDLIPASVSRLSLVSHGKSHYEKALDALFWDLAARKDDQVSALEKIYLSCPRDADSLYKKQCEKLAAETEKAGVLLHLKS